MAHSFASSTSGSLHATYALPVTCAQPDLRPDPSADGFSLQSAYFLSKMSQLVFSEKDEVESVVKGELGYPHFLWFEVRATEASEARLPSRVARGGGDIGRSWGLVFDHSSRFPCAPLGTLYNWRDPKPACVLPRRLNRRFST